MRSLSEVVDDAKSVNAVAKLSRISAPDFAKPIANTLHETLLETAVDLEYGKAFARAHGREHKLSVLKRYVHDPNSYVSKSGWFKTAIIGLELENGRIDRRKKSADPVKIAIAKIKTQCPKLCQRKICAALDRMNVELPERWQHLSNRTWMCAYRDSRLRPLLKSFISKVQA